jgi:hypothetical protein
LKKSNRKAPRRSAPGAAGSEAPANPKNPRKISKQRTPLEGENRSVPNLLVTLTEAQTPIVADAVERLRALSRDRRRILFGPLELRGNELSICPLDACPLLGLCERTPATEIELFRLRRAALAEIEARLQRVRNAVVRAALESARALLEEKAVGADRSMPSSNPRAYRPVALVE